MSNRPPMPRTGKQVGHRRYVWTQDGMVELPMEQSNAAHGAVYYEATDHAALVEALRGLVERVAGMTYFSDDEGEHGHCNEKECADKQFIVEMRDQLKAARALLQRIEKGG